MLVNDWMSAPVITVDIHDSMNKAVNLMTEHNIGMLPVLENGKLVGIVTDRDLKQAAPSSVALFEIKHIIYHLSQVKMEGIMTRHPVTVRPDTTIEETAEILLQNNISGCPVLDRQDELAGVITKNDVFRAMLSVSGIPKKGVQFGLLVEDSPGAIKEVTDLIREHHCRLISILTTYEKAPQGYRHVYIRAFDVGRERLTQLKQALTEKARLEYLVDLREGTRETYASY
jgi:acetoin utilization protein AcuB